jgi:hypothetical protein
MCTVAVSPWQISDRAVREFGCSTRRDLSRAQPANRGAFWIERERVNCVVVAFEPTETGRATGAWTWSSTEFRHFSPGFECVSADLAPRRALTASPTRS